MSSQRSKSASDRFHRASVHLLVAIVAGLILGLFLPDDMGVPVRLVAAWDLGAACWIGLSWWIIGRADAHETRRRAAAEDPGRTVGWAMMLIVSAFSLFATGFLIRQSSGHGTVDSRHLLVALSLVAIIGAWVATHTAYTLRYAHLHYRDRGQPDGAVTFPGQQPPSYVDFAYLAFTVGMCFQVSDASVTTRELRRAVLAHAVLSFSYNTVILAVAINLIVGQMG